MQTISEQLEKLIGSEWVDTRELADRLPNNPTRGSMSRGLARLMALGAIEKRRHPLNWRRFQYRKPQPTQGDN